MCPVRTNKVEIKCMGSIGEKTPTKPKLCSLLLFSNLSTVNKIKLIFDLVLARVAESETGHECSILIQLVDRNKLLNQWKDCLSTSNL